MKTKEKENPVEGKSNNGNNEPWLTAKELYFEMLAVKMSYSKWK